MMNRCIPMAPTLQISIDRVNRPCYLLVWLGCPKPPHCARVAYSRRQLCMELSTFFPAQKEKILPTALGNVLKAYQVTREMTKTEPFHSSNCLPRSSISCQHKLSVCPSVLIMSVSVSLPVIVCQCPSVYLPVSRSVSLSES